MQEIENFTNETYDGIVWPEIRELEWYHTGARLVLLDSDF